MELNDKKIMQAVSAYCKLNNIEDIDSFVNKCFESGFNIEKYGLLGKTLNEGEKDLIIDKNSKKMSGIQEKRVEIEVIREKRVEIPVEVIKEVEKIIEVPVEIIKEIVVEKEVIKEVPVEKIVTKIEYISDKENENELIKKIEQLEQNIFHLNEQIESERKIFSTKTKEMENIFQKELDENKVKMLQQTIQTLNIEIRDLKNKNEELNKKMLEIPNKVGDIPAKFHGSSNLNDNIYR